MFGIKEKFKGELKRVVVSDKSDNYLTELQINAK